MLYERTRSHNRVRQAPITSHPNPSYYVHCTVYIVQCTLYSVHRTMYIVQCTLYSVRCTVYIVQCTSYSVHCTVYVVQCTLYSVHRTVYTQFNIASLSSMPRTQQMFSKESPQTVSQRSLLLFLGVVIFNVLDFHVEYYVALNGQVFFFFSAQERIQLKRSNEY